MLICQLIRIIVFVAINATECREIPRNHMALDAQIPLVVVSARVDREILTVVVEI